MKLFLAIAAVCIAATVATEVSHEDQVRHEEMLAELCKETGIFPNPHDPEGRTFIRCELEPVELRCDDGFIFDAEKLMCVEEPKPEPIPVDMDKVDWMAVLKCPNFEDKYYRNPYDCHRFYRCYQEGHFQRIGLGQCVPSMIFDDVLETCLPADQFKSYYGHGCEARALPIEFTPGHEHKHDENEEPHKHDENEEPHKNDGEGEHENKHDENEEPHKHDENEEPHKNDGEGEHENKHDENEEPHKHDENEDPTHHGHDENENKGDNENEEPHKHDGEGEHDHQHQENPDNGDGEHQNHESNHEQEKEPEKVPSLKDILKEIQEMFNKKH